MATRNFGGPPAIDFTNSTTSASPADDRLAPDTPVGARNSPNTSRISPPHSPVVPPALASAIDGGITLSPCDGGAPEVVERSVDSGLVARRPPRPHVGDHLCLDGGVDLQDRALAAER